MEQQQWMPWEVSYNCCVTGGLGMYSKYRAALCQKHVAMSRKKWLLTFFVTPHFPRNNLSCSCEVCPEVPIDLNTLQDCHSSYSTNRGPKKPIQRRWLRNFRDLGTPWFIAFSWKTPPLNPVACYWVQFTSLLHLLPGCPKQFCLLGIAASLLALHII